MESELSGYSMSSEAGSVAECEFSIETIDSKDLYGFARGVYMGASMGIGAFYLIGVTLGGPAFLAVVLTGAILGGGAAKKAELNRRKGVMKSRVHELSTRMRNSIILPQNDQDSLVDQFIENTKTELGSALTQMYELEKARLEEQLQKLSEQAELNQQESQEALVQLKDRMGVWSGIGKQLQGEIGKLRQLQEALA
jgi:hypothetical protein